MWLNITYGIELIVMGLFGFLMYREWNKPSEDQSIAKLWCFAGVTILSWASLSVLVMLSILSIIP